MTLVAGSKKLQEGTLTVLDGDIASVRHRRAVCPRIAYMPQGLGKNLYLELSVHDNVDFMAQLAGFFTVGMPGDTDAIQKAAEALSKQVEEIHGRFVAPPPEFLGNAGPPLAYTPPPFSQRVNRLMGAIEGYSAAPTSQQAEELGAVSRLLGEASERLRKLVDEDLAALNKQMNEAGIPHITVAAPEGERPHGRR